MMKLILICSLAVIQQSAALEIFQEIFRWKQLDFDWPSESVKAKIISKNGFGQINITISGIKVWKTNIYLTLPRFRPGVPVTLASVSAIAIPVNQSPKLRAYPSYDMQIIGDCKAFQHVQSMEIDPQGRMWVIDSGRVNLLTESPRAVCPPKLVILDLEDDGNEILRYEFPESVSAHNQVFLDDIVVDSTDGGYAYITDTSAVDPGIIVYSMKRNKSWKVRHDSMNFEPKAAKLTINDQQIDMPFPIDGIALSPLGDGYRYVYYCALSGYHLYSLPTTVLKLNLNPKPSVKNLGDKTSPTDGMVMTADGTLYFGLNANNAVASWRSALGKVTDNIQVLETNYEKLNWPDSFGICDAGNLWITTDRLANYYNGDVNPEDFNFRVLKTSIGVRNYQYLPDGSKPNL